jgi:DNA-binding NtrC family response regulator
MTKPFIMLVDDEVSFVKILAKRLVEKQFNIITAFNAEEGLEKLEANPEVEVIVLDVKMPRIDGIKMLKTVKSEYPKTEVILLTGHATIESAINGMKLGAYDFITKPCDIDDLVRTIRGAIKKWSHDGVSVDDESIGIEK